MASLSLVEKVSMLFMMPVPDGLDPAKASDRARLEREILHFGAGGVVFMGGNPLGHAAVAAWLDSQVELPVIKALDAEWGTGMRQHGMPVYARAMGLAASRDAALTRDVGYRTGRAARASGISMVFAPVADVNTEPTNPVIGTRAFSDHPDTVRVHAAAFAEGLRAAGVAAVAKHFPGHGSTTLDSHVALPLSGHDAELLADVDLVPFRQLIADSIAGLMTAHVLYSGADGMPATLDSTLLTVLLRDSLGYGGLIVTDALNMAGVTSTGTPEDVAVQAVLAGADILLMSPDPFAARAALVQAVRDGRVPESRLDASVRRILEARMTMQSPPDLVALMGLAERERLTTVDVASRALTLVKRGEDVLPGDRGTGHVAVLETDSREHAPDTGPGRALGAHLASLMPDTVDVIRISPRTWQRDLARAENTVRSAHTVIWLDATGVTPVSGWDMQEFGERLDALHDRVVGMSVDSPWAIPAMAPSVDALLVAYDALDTSLAALARAFVGRGRV
jgi:beta-N-acetylhexosaminidase